MILLTQQVVIFLKFRNRYSINIGDDNLKLKVGDNMKVFISWSGDKSHRIAKIFRDWLPLVIQSLVPYVSSEDIDKGARWSSDIASELADSSFGILCVTKENLNAPWLCFEAGALSKTVEKTYVSPFLFDVKRSEVDGPLLQFQSTIFEKEDIKKLIDTLNKACGDSCLTQERLDITFDMLYPNLEKNLKEVLEDVDYDLQKEEDISNSSDILEEILDLSRENQKLLRNPDNNLQDTILKINDKLSHTLYVYEKECNSDRAMQRRKGALYDEFSYEFIKMARNYQNKTYGFLLVLSLFKEDYPWIYEMGKEVVSIINSKKALTEKKDAIYQFKEMLDFSFNHPLLREMNRNKLENTRFYKDIQYALLDFLESICN